MEQSGKTIGECIKSRSLDEYWRETKKIMLFLGFNYLTSVDENIGQCVSALISAELTFNPHKGELSTWKFKHVLNECKELLVKQKTKKRKLLSNSLSTKSLFDKANNSYDNRIISPEVVADAKSVVEYIENTGFLTESQKKCFLNHYYLGMSHGDISLEMKISRARVGKIISKALEILRYKYGKDINNLYG